VGSGQLDNWRASEVVECKQLLSNALRKNIDFRAKILSLFMAAGEIKHFI
jgi:hypothetical protein